uniref:CemA n=1 Tax=Pseudanomodon attenuatus TaxID=2779804 RepID=UPI001D119576|nr:CemA [Pseudanomodon attenuatus]QZJ47219.1 CemA [Pseudanomodon attenuatus]
MQFYFWLSKTPYRSLERAYKTSKKIQHIKKDYFSYKNKSLSSRRSWQAIMLYINTNLNNYVFIIYCSLLEYKISLAYESIGLVPRSITRTLSGFQAELTGQSTSLVLQDFQISRYQALASVQYMLFLFSFPWGFSIFFKIWFLEPWLKNWWNTYQFQIFLNSFQQEIALKRLQEIEELIWLDKIMVNSLKEIKSHDLNIEIHQKTIQLVEIYNENSLNTLLQLLTDIIYFIILSAVFILGKKRLAILNSWIQELFYSLSDTMKAFSILLLTDLCIGFHSPHGWEIVIGSFLEHLGFAHNKHIISCFVSTFPVILDTVFKYWIFRHLNRISPSIVATYHTMNE